MSKLIKNSFLIFLISWKGLFGSIIRDTETESYVRSVLNEILVASDLEPKSVNLFLTKGDSINAFVYNGANIFVDIALLQAFSGYEPLQAVLAHEVGHLKAYHIINFSKNIDKAMVEALLYSISGIALALGGGGVNALIVGLSAGSNVLEKRVLSYSRTQEAEADFYAFQVLSRVKASKDGVLKVFQKFQNLQEKFVDVNKMNEYSTTHPFPSSRFNFFARKFAEVSYIPEKNMAFEKAHLLVIAKLAGYFGNLRLEYSTAFMQNEEARLYFEGFTSLRKQNFKEAEKIFTEMLKKYGENPYLHEVLGQIKVKQENYNDAIFHFSKALELKPDEFLFLLDFAEVYAIKKDFQKAIFYAEKALKKEPYNPQVTIKLAEFYSKKGESGIAKLYFIETEILRENYKKAKVLTEEIAKKHYVLPANFKVKLSDIEEFLKTK